MEITNKKHKIKVLVPSKLGGAILSRLYSLTLTPKILQTKGKQKISEHKQAVYLSTAQYLGISYAKLWSQVTLTEPSFA